MPAGVDGAFVRPNVGRLPYGCEIVATICEVAVIRRPAERSLRLPCVREPDLESNTVVSCLLVEVTA